MSGGNLGFPAKTFYEYVGKRVFVILPTFYTILHVDAGRGRDLEAQFVPRKDNDVPLFMHKTDETDPGGD